MFQSALSQTLFALTPALAGFTILLAITGRLSKGLYAVYPLKTEKEQIFAYRPKMRKFMFFWAALSLILALIGFVSCGLKYYGPDPLPPTHPCYRPGEDWWASLALFVMCGLSSIFLLLDPIKYFVKMDKNGVTIRGLITGERFCAWDDLYEINHHASLQMLSLKGRRKAGKPIRLWIPVGSPLYPDVPDILERLSERGLSLKEGKE